MKILRVDCSEHDQKKLKEDSILLLFLLLCFFFFVFSFYFNILPFSNSEFHNGFPWICK